MPPDVLLYGSVANSLSRTQSTGSAELDQLRSTEGAMADDPEGGVDNGDAETTVTGVGSRAPGDLVELRYDSIDSHPHCDWPLIDLKDNLDHECLYLPYIWDHSVTGITFTPSMAVGSRAWASHPSSLCLGLSVWQS